MIELIVIKLGNKLNVIKPMKKYRFILALILILVVFQMCTTLDYSSVGSATEPKLPNEVYNYSNLELPNVKNSFNSNVLSVFTNANGDTLRLNGDASNFQNLIINGSFKFIREELTQQISFFNINITDEGATLGRVLFYDKALSVNDRISCGSCHHQEKAFTDGLAVSPGFENKLTPRSSMSIANAVLSNNLFWDSRVSNLLDLSLKPVQNHIEMGLEKIETLPAKLANKPYYKALFKSVYKDEYITEQRISDAISQFVGSITSANTAFDKGTMSAIQKEGHTVFLEKCNTCHTEGTFAADDSPGGEYGISFNGGGSRRGATNIGLDIVSVDKGLGQDNFKIPTLRNVMLTAPYMHDGRFKDIDAVLDHYTKGIKQNRNLDKKLLNDNGSIKHIQLSDYERYTLKAFLTALTDDKMITDPKYSDPFRD